MGGDFLYFIEVTTGGLLAGVMYSLVALGFVLIFKASGIFNFAQGVMALFAALTLVGLMEKLGVPAWVAIVMTIGVMILLAWLIERLVLQHLVNQDPIILFMATIGLAYVLEGVGDLMWGSDVKVLNVGLPDGAVDWMFDLGIYVTKLELVAAARWPRYWSPCLQCSSRRPASDGPCAPWRTTIRQRCRSAFRCEPYGSSSGRSPASWRWSPVSCGAAVPAFSSRCH